MEFETSRRDFTRFYLKFCKDRSAIVALVANSYLLMEEQLKKGFLKDQRFDVEHALSLYAISSVLLPAKHIYDKDWVEPFRQNIERCHIYLIGQLPEIKFLGADSDSKIFTLSYRVACEECHLAYELPAGGSLQYIDGGCYICAPDGKLIWPDDDDIASRLQKVTQQFNFEILYIGQAYGKKGSRNALDRLLKHEKLQKIALKGTPRGYMHSVVMLEVSPTGIMAMFNPFANEKDIDNERIDSGVEKLFGTRELERITLYEAALIRYFEPLYNHEFKNSFPSTNLKVLDDCYKNDVAAIIAELDLIDFRYTFSSGKIESASSHMAMFNLHEKNDRDFFFGLV